jgi:hypothetical protein
MENGIPDEQSIFAAEGTAAHEVAEMCLAKGMDAIEFIDRVITVGGRGKEDMKFTVNQNMADAVQIYVDYCRELIETADKYLLETKVPIAVIEDSGTADFIAYHKKEQRLEIVDYKHGQGIPVEARDNTQGLLYALGAIQLFHKQPIEHIRITIIQPRSPHEDGPIRSWDLNYDEQLDWAMMFAHGVHATKAVDAPLLAGDHCKFCKAAPMCPTLRDKSMEICMADFAPSGEVIVSEPATLSPAKIAAVLQEVSIVENWCKRVKEHAFREAVDGRCPPGFKVVATRATRRWKDRDDATGFLTLYGLDEKDMFTEPELRSVAQLEKVIGKKNINDISHLVEKVSSGVTLVKESDPRPPITASASSDFE